MKERKLITRRCIHSISVQAQPTSTLKLPQAGALMPLQAELQSIEPETGLEGQEPSPIKLSSLSWSCSCMKTERLSSNKTLCLITRYPGGMQLGESQYLPQLTSYSFTKCLIKPEPSADFWEGSWHVGRLF